MPRVVSRCSIHCSFVYCRSCWQNSRSLVGTYVDLVAETEKDTVISIRLTDSEAFKKHPQAGTKSHGAVIYNPSQCGEASSKPHIRPPPLRQAGDHLKRLTAITLNAFSWSIAENQIYFIYDAGKTGSAPIHPSIRLSSRPAGQLDIKSTANSTTSRIQIEPDLYANMPF